MCFFTHNYILYKEKININLILLINHSNKFLYYLTDHLPQRRSRSLEVSGNSVELL